MISTDELLCRKRFEGWVKTIIFINFIEKEHQITYERTNEGDYLVNIREQNTLRIIDDISREFFGWRAGWKAKARCRR